MISFWKLVNWLVTASAIVLILSILFAPFEVFARYAFMLFMTVIVLAASLILHSFIKFVKETPKRKWSAPKQEVPSRIILGLKVKTWKNSLEWTGMLVVLVILVLFQRGVIGSKACPDLVRGNAEGNTTVQYFYTPFCPACWKGELFMQRMIGKYSAVRFENYDIRYCKDIEIRNTPAYRITKGSTAQVVHGLNARRFGAALCAVSGACP